MNTMNTMNTNHNIKQNKIYYIYPIRMSHDLQKKINIFSGILTFEKRKNININKTIIYLIERGLSAEGNTCKPFEENN